MIRITGVDLNRTDLSSLSGMEKLILHKKQNSSEIYHYDSLYALLFELKMRSNTVAAAKALFISDASFATFNNTKGNEQYWERTSQGGLKQKHNAASSEAIRDIFRQGALYAFECATAMVIILYKAALDSLGDDVFNAYFNHLLLYDWNYDNNLQLIANMDNEEAVPGDVLYFKNPDYNTKTPEWQGENVILLADNLYFGHGIGIHTASQMIAYLNRHRIPGSSTSAYLTDLIEHPDFDYLQKIELPAAAKLSTRFLYLRRIYID
ncbi:protein-glutamine gamma-glutamyltransferase [Paenibacillus sp. GCM10027626]|uniref:protein-glutamine gamma-glutamyltransferase n=1 Tax=Paenibacillus sp. GCM10027626 TaxID=3273411 RepID=UPI00363F6592